MAEVCDWAGTKVPSGRELTEVAPRSSLSSPDGVYSHEITSPPVSLVPLWGATRDHKSPCLPRPTLGSDTRSQVPLSPSSHSGERHEITSPPVSLVPLWGATRDHKSPCLPRPTLGSDTRSGDHRYAPPPSSHTSDLTAT